MPYPPGPTNAVRSRPRPAWGRGEDSNLRRRKPADLQSAPVGRLGTPPRKRAAYSDFGAPGCQCMLARKLLGSVKNTAERVGLRPGGQPGDRNGAQLAPHQPLELARRDMNGFSQSG